MYAIIAEIPPVKVPKHKISRILCKIFYLKTFVLKNAINNKMNSNITIDNVITKYTD